MADRPEYELETRPRRDRPQPPQPARMGKVEELLKSLEGLASELSMHQSRLSKHLDRIGAPYADEPAQLDQGVARGRDGKDLPTLDCMEEANRELFRLSNQINLQVGRVERL